MVWYLSADVGGTNSRLLGVQMDDNQETRRVYHDYPSQKFPDFISVIKTFLTDNNITSVNAACLAVAGPIRAGSAKITNLPWQINETELARALSTRHVVLMNDFSGIAHGIAELGSKDVQPLQVVTGEVSGPVVVLGAGTGLGMAIVHTDANGVKVMESEAGHMGFSPNDDEELDLLKYWKPRLQRITHETFLSGMGIARIFEYYAHHSDKPPSSELTIRLNQTDKQPVVINEFAQHRKEPLAVKTMQRFAAIYASVAADMALATKASGGVYLAGGIAPASLSFLQTDHFLQIFNNKPPMNDLLATIPVNVVMNTSVGLLGAMAVARTLTS